MSKPIRMTQQYIEECRQDFEKALKLIKMSDGKFNFTKTFSVADRKAVVCFTGEAWAKMSMLIKGFDNEVAWHGIASRVNDDDKDEYVISDIVVYPQEVTGATVEMDTERYSEWLIENIEDERFDNIRMQGHSHVNMGVTPSSVDLNHQEEILNMLGDDDFYIFMIWNKSFASNTKVYDMKKNILFENSDVTVKLIGAVDDLDEFLEDAKSKVKPKTYYTAGKGKLAGAPYNPTAASTAQHKGDTKKVPTEEKARTRLDSGCSEKNACGDPLWDGLYGGYPHY